MPIPEHAHSLEEPDLVSAMEAADEAGALIRTAFDKVLAIREKGVGDLVSEVDELADKTITQRLRGHDPKVEILSEELQPEHNISHAERAWIIDPLDATSGFLFRTGKHISSVMIALREQAAMKLGVVYFPLSEEWFYASKGKGAYKNGKPLSVAHTANTLHESWVDMNHYGDAALETPEFALLRERLRSPKGARLVTSQVPHSGVAMRILEGEQRLSAVVHDNNPKKVKQDAWDTAAPSMIVREAGGVFLTLNGQEYDPFHPEPIIVAGQRQVAEEIMALLRNV